MSCEDNAKKKRKANLRRKLKQRYGLTLADYQAMVAEQDNKCAICFQPCTVNERLSVDHCHTTGQVRGLLCACCNSILGMAKDSPTVLISAVRYLAKYLGTNLEKEGDDV